MAKRREKFAEERTMTTHIQPLTPKQGEYLDALKSSEQVIVLGPAGTGKTYIAGSYGASQLRTGRVSKLVITRPNVPGGRSLGFFPGTMEEKIAPWVVPILDVLRQRLGGGVVDNGLRSGAIEIVPFEVMRGRTFDNAFVILDEAQNTTPAEIKMFLTRLGKDTQVVLNGDISQSDLRETSGLAKVIGIAKRHMLPLPIVEFSLDDIVRSDLCAMWVRAFHQEGVN